LPSQLAALHASFDKMPELETSDLLKLKKFHK
jgi:hypothetical protein